MIEEEVEEEEEEVIVEEEVIEEEVLQEVEEVDPEDLEEGLKFLFNHTDYQESSLLEDHKIL